MGCGRFKSANVGHVAQLSTARLSAFPGNSDPAARVALVVALGEASFLCWWRVVSQGTRRVF